MGPPSAKFGGGCSQGIPPPAAPVKLIPSRHSARDQNDPPGQIRSRLWRIRWRIDKLPALEANNHAGVDAGQRHHPF